MVRYSPIAEARRDTDLQTPAKPWQKSFPATTDGSSEPITLTLTIHPSETETYPQHHRLLLSSANLSPLLRWAFDVTPFTLRSLARRAEWEGCDDEEELGKLFAAFLGRVRERVGGCCADPKR